MSISDVYIHGPDLRRQVVSVETSTPKARLFVEALLASPIMAATDYSLTSRELRAIVDRTDLADVTKPMSEPFPDVIQDLWQLSHLTTSYLARALAGGILLATGIVENNAVAIVVAALFLPFLAEVLAISFGLWSRDRALILRGLAPLPRARFSPSSAARSSQVSHVSRFASRASKARLPASQFRR